MQTKSTNPADMTPDERLTEIAELLAKAIHRLKQRELKDRENG